VRKSSLRKVLRVGRLFEPRLGVPQTVQVTGVALATWAIATHIEANWWMLALAVYFATSCLGMAVGVHRGICHQAFDLNRALDRGFSVFASIGMTGSPLGWIGTHRTHHAHADTLDDPHGPKYCGWKLL
jgi:stearoyl-CoA desaturase (delta-9 desaturase)